MAPRQQSFMFLTPDNLHLGWRTAVPGTKALLWLTLLLVLVSGGCSKPKGLVILNPQNPERDYDFDLGRLALGEVREYVVQLKNAEGRPLSIREVASGCSCTTPKLSYLNEQGARVEGPILWNQQAFVVPKDAVIELALRVESKLVPNPNAVKRVIVRIQTDSEVDPAKTLEVHMVVDVPFYVVPKMINLGRVPIGGIAQGKTEISRAMGTGELILGVLSKPENVDVVLETPEDLGAMFWRVHVRWFPPHEHGAQMSSVLLSTSGPHGVGEGPPLEIQLLTIGVEDVVADPMLFSLPQRLEINSGAGAVQLRSMVGGNRILVTGATPEGPFAECFRASATAISPDANGRSEQWIVQLTCTRPPETSEAFSGHVVVNLDDAVTPIMRIPYQRKLNP